MPETGEQARRNGRETEGRVARGQRAVQGGLSAALDRLPLQRRFADHVAEYLCLHQAGASTLSMATRNRTM